MLRKAYDSPQTRRLRSDRTALERLRDESTIFRFRASGDPAQRYLIEFHGASLARERGKVAIHRVHQVEVKLGASYPRSMPELRWLSPIYHPNISEIGLVCLGGYNTHWVPSLQLDELCEMLWDMARFHNYDLRSPYNRDAALWAASQSTFTFPIDHRPLRDLRVARGRVEASPPMADLPTDLDIPTAGAIREGESIMILDAEVELPARREAAEPRSSSPPDVLFID